MQFACSITSPEFKARLDQLVASNPEIEALLYLLGPNKILEWAHTIGVATNADLAALAPPIPPEDVRSITASPTAPVFLWSGLWDTELFADLYARYGSKGEDIAILDFGAGCGRTARFFAQAPQYKTYICDVNSDLVAWCKSALPGVTAAKNNPKPPLPFEAETFDFVFALSVFAHLPETAVLAWLYEIFRVVKPGGIAALSIHGRTAIDLISVSKTHQDMFGVSPELMSQITSQYQSNGFAYLRHDADVLTRMNVGDDFGNSFIHSNYIRTQCKQARFDILKITPGGLRGWQDMVVLMRPRTTVRQKGARHGPIRTIETWF